VVNDRTLWDQHPDMQRNSELDSEVIFRLIDEAAGRSDNINEAISSALAQIFGVVNIAMLRTDTSTIELATNNGSMYFFRIHDRHCIVFASERHILRKALARMGMGASANEAEHLRAGQGASLSYVDASASVYQLDTPPSTKVPPIEPAAPIVWRRPQRSAM